MMLIVFVTTVLVLCASLFAMMAIVPLMVANRTARTSSDNVVPFTQPQRPSGHTDSTAA